jgi:drug/metabolite transporter (DMT)-like permease
MPVNLTAALAVGFVALFPSVVAQLFWAEAVGRVGATVAGYFIYLTPVFGAAMAIAFLSETPAWFHAAGIALIFAGIYLATAARHRPA